MRLAASDVVQTSLRSIFDDLQRTWSRYNDCLIARLSGHRNSAHFIVPTLLLPVLA